MNEPKKVLVTGAGGFIGGFIVQECLRRGYQTWAAVRSSTNREFLTDQRIRFIELDFTDDHVLSDTLSAHINEHGPWDYVVHNLGATKAASYIEFERVNHYYLRLLVETLRSLGALPQTLLLMSSLSVMGPGDEQGYTPLKATDAPHPNTRYGTSKLKAEVFLQSQSDLPSIIFRCTGVYGPHERDYFLMIKSINNGFDFGVGRRKQLLTFIYVEDLAAAICDALERAPRGNIYLISEPRSYTQAEFRQIVCHALQKRHVLAVTCPLWVVKTACAIGGRWSAATLKPVTLNSDKYNILRQRNWQCDVQPAIRDFGFAPAHSLEQGMAKTIEWYRQAKWL